MHTPMLLNGWLSDLCYGAWVSFFAKPFYLRISILFHADNVVRTIAMHVRRVDLGEFGRFEFEKRRI